MTDARFDDLLQRMLDDELAEDDARTLAAELRFRPDRARTVRQHLVLWELWAQRHAPERRAESFTAACRTRLHATQHGDEFVTEFARRAQATVAPLPAAPAAPAAWVDAVAHGWREATRPLRLVATGLTAALIVGLLWFSTARPARAAVVLRGEAVCTACFLHETAEHLPAIRVPGANGGEVYYVESDRKAVYRVGNYCAAPVPLVATGDAAVIHGRQLISLRSVERRQAPPADPASPRERTLFPF